MPNIFLKKAKNVNKIIFHHYGEHVPPGVDVPLIRHMHITERGWDDIGYHGIILPDGRFSIGRDIQKTGAHTWGFNTGSIGIMFVAGSSVNEITKPDREQLKTARNIIREQIEYYGELQVVGHRDLSDSHCPGFDVNYWYRTGKISA